MERTATAGGAPDAHAGHVAPDALDAAFERLAAAGFELPNGFVNHGAMACEALAVLDIGADLEKWAGRFRHVRGGVDVAPVVDPVSFDGRSHLGDYQRLSEWIGFFDASIRVDGWEAVVDEWVPALAAAFSVKLFHGAIRVGHATRAISSSASPARRAELARALAYWAARYRPGAPTTVADEPDVLRAVLDIGVTAARRYVEDPDIFTLHGVTSAMAAALLLPHVGETAALQLLAQVRADHTSFYGALAPVALATTSAVEWSAVSADAAASYDAHQVKLVEACKRGWEATGDAAFAGAAAIVTG
jgi:hypothetical protein